MKKRNVLLLWVALILIAPLASYGLTLKVNAPQNILSSEHITALTGKKLSFQEKLGLKILRKLVNQQDAHKLFGCSKIVLKNGNIIEADISQITPNEVKYKRCGKPNDPETVISKNDVLRIKDADGTDIFVNTGDNAIGDYPSGQQVDGYAIASIATAVGGLILGLLVAAGTGALAGACAVVLGIMSLRRINREPKKYSGKGLAIAGLILGSLMFLISSVFTLLALAYL